MDSRGNTSATLTTDNNERSIPEVLKGIVSSIQQIIRSEIKLAKREVTENAQQARSAAIALAADGVFGIYALGFLLLAAMFALELVLPNWLSALIIGLVLLAGTGLGISLGRQRLKTIRPVRKTMQSVKEDVQWMTEQPRS